MNQDMTPVYIILFGVFALIGVGAFLIINFRSRAKSKRQNNWTDSKHKFEEGLSNKISTKNVKGWVYLSYFTLIFKTL